MTFVCDPPMDQLQLRPHSREHSATVADWVEPGELRTLAPGTAGPLSAAKVDGWTLGEQDTPFLLWNQMAQRPVAYAELNQMPSGTGEWWIGHVIVEPALRGRGIGTRLVKNLISTAFTRPLCRRVSLVVFPDNAHAVQCYLKNGMRTDGVQSHRFKMQATPCRMLRMTISRRRYERQRPAGRGLGSVLKRLRF